MKVVLEFLVEHGGMLLAGVSVLLAAGLLLVEMHRQPIHRQRIAEGTMALCVVFAVVASVPLPRFRIEAQSKPPPVKTIPLYRPQPGDEVIAAEVFKVSTQERENPVVRTGSGAPTMAPQLSTPPKAGWNWAMFFAQLYLAGMALCALYVGFGYVLLRRLLRTSRECPAQPDLPVRVRICEGCDRPISFGLLKPTILLPVTFQRLDHPRQQHILRHELAHIAQRDAVGHLLFNLLFPLLYFHPLYWILRGVTNFARELIADDLASAQSSRESYAADLLAMARERFARAAIGTHALGLFRSKSDLYRRMHMLMQTNAPLARQCSMGWRMGYFTLLVAALLAAGGTLGVRRANAQAADPQQKEAAARERSAQEEAAQRQAELIQLRAQQEQIKAQLDVLEVEKRKLQDELDARRAEGAAADTVEKRMRLRREQAVQETRERDAAAMLAKIEAQQDDAARQRDQAAQNERQAMKRWMDVNNGGGKREQNEFGGRAQLDLVLLANSYVDALGNLQLAKLELDQLAGTVGPEHAKMKTEGAILKVKLQTAERKVAIFRGIAKAAMEAARADLEVATQQFKGGLAPVTAVNDAQSRLRIIEVILAQ